MVLCYFGEIVRLYLGFYVLIVVSAIDSLCVWSLLVCLPSVCILYSFKLFKCHFCELLPSIMCSCNSAQ